MAVTVTKTTKRVFNPHKGKKSAKKTTSAAPQRKNPAMLYAVGPLNPERKAMPKTTKKKYTSKTPAKKSNPFGYAKKPTANSIRPKKRRNGSSSFATKPVQMLKTAMVALSGLVVARQLPQMLLSTRNTGNFGYAANIGTALLGGFLVGKFAGAENGYMFAIGGTAYSLSRVLTEKFSPFGQVFALSGVGDAQAAGMGAIRPWDWNVPLQTDSQGRAVVPAFVNRTVNNAIASMPRPVQTVAGLPKRYQRAA